jgi:hypothetical protein
MHFGPGFAFPVMTALMSAKLIVDSDAFTHGEQEQLKNDIAAIKAAVSPDAMALYEDLTKVTDRLEEDMRRYVYDIDAGRRIACLDAYRERLGMVLWKDREQ